jgi:hypothetical protein
MGVGESLSADILPIFSILPTTADKEMLHQRILDKPAQSKPVNPEIPPIISA